MANPFRVLVTGGRDFKDVYRVYRTLNLINNAPGVAVVIHGGATGADAIAKMWAKEYGVPEEPYPADWSDLSHPDALIKTTASGRKYDARAGLRRNQRMIDEGKPDVIAAFPGGKGTRDMVRRAKAAGLWFAESAGGP